MISPVGGVGPQPHMVDSILFILACKSDILSKPS